MEGASEKLTITLRIGNNTVPLTINREEEIIYRNAERMINTKLNFYSEHYPGQGYEMYLSMGLLDIASGLVRNEMRNDTEPFTNSINALLEEIKETLDKK
jgi:hypothetical protein